jgi:hypothetical protein
MDFKTTNTSTNQTEKTNPNGMTHTNVRVTHLFNKKCRDAVKHINPIRTPQMSYVEIRSMFM